ncbi:MAG: hypothetical protein AB2L24_05115 [Mangrovibacterium sp.]
MQFSPEKYAVEDKPMTPFIDAKEIWDYLNKTTPSADQVREIIKRMINEIGDDVLATNVKTRISKILNGERDLYF